MVSHPIELVPPKLFLESGHEGDGPVLLERDERQFVKRVKAELANTKRHGDVQKTVVKKRKDGGYHLYQPIHRMFHMAVLSANCVESFRSTRVDPLRIESAGLVVRKVRNGQGECVGELGWLVDSEGNAFWQAPDVWDPATKQAVPQVKTHAKKSSNTCTVKPIYYADPDPARRPRRSVGHAALDQRIAMLKGLGDSASESITPLFPLSPSECARAGETLLVGLVQTASRETEQSPGITLPEREDLDAAGFFPALLTVAASETFKLPLKGQVVTGKMIYGDTALHKVPAVAAYIDFVRSMMVGFDVAGDSKTSLDLRAILEDIDLLLYRLPKKPAITVNLYEHLVAAYPVLVGGELDSSFQMPNRWGEITDDIERQLKKAIEAATKARFATLAHDRERFGEPGASYIVRAFVRVRGDDNCPPHLHWSQPSNEFKIAPWYDSSPGPRPTIQLPNPIGNEIKAIKPNVAFAVPSALAELLGKNDPEQLLEGEGDPPGGGGLAWLCTFSIPIITICAFVLLSIIIQLLNFVFWWLPFVKICIPLPKIK